MSALRFFIDTHDTANGTLPADLTPSQLAAFYAAYRDACAAEGVVPLRLHLGAAAGRAYCYTMAPDAEAVRRAHARVGLPFDDIAEVSTLTPADTFLAA